LPDGPFIEKGGMAQAIRRGNSAATNATPTWALNRTLYTQVGNSLVTPTTGNTGLSQQLLDFVSGMDTGDENQNGNIINGVAVNETRPSLHGDVIHSRPVPINYGGATGVVLYYGANDGTFRAAAVPTTNGAERELWVACARVLHAHPPSDSIRSTCGG
jgi:type IV pilus assembly protein PilY1